jgi:signal transduction histidine kinase
LPSTNVKTPLIERALKSLDGLFERLSSNAILAFALLCAIALGVLDYYSAPNLLVLYLAPIFLASWYAGFGPGLVVAIYSAGSVYISTVVLRKSHEANSIELINLMVELVAYVTIAKVISKLKESRRQTGFIVHDLRAPIANAISGLMTLQQSGQHLGEAEREMLDLALVSSQRAVTLVSSLLDVAKLESGKFHVGPETVLLDDFIDDCFHQVELWARSNHVTLERNILAREASIDPALTSRVLVNLLSNALKFSPEGCTVRVRAQIVHRALRIAVEDQGPGIPKDYVKSVFQPFTQAKNSQTGTGLGLTFCRLAVHAQHGHIWIDPDVEQGTTVWFSIPQAQADVEVLERLPQPTEV